MTMRFPMERASRNELVLGMAARRVPRDRIANYLGIRLKALELWCRRHRITLPYSAKTYASRKLKDSCRRRKLKIMPQSMRLCHMATPRTIAQ